MKNKQGTVVFQWSSHLANGNPDPGALKIELDIPLSSYGTPNGQGHVTIWGVGLQAISQQKNLVGMSISVNVGMAKGLPLANPNQRGPAIVGQIFQAWGNWINTEQRLDIIFQPPSGSVNQPVNLSLNWQANQPLSQAVTTSLKTAFPNSTINVNISPNLVTPANEPSYYHSLVELNTYLYKRSKSIITNSTYQGVQITNVNNTITVTDGTQSTKQTPKTIAFTDIIGQPVWQNQNTIQVMFVMRGDIFNGTQFTLPKSQQTQTQGSSVPLDQNNQTNLNFNGNFISTLVRILGNSRQPHAEAWITVVDAIAQSVNSSTGAVFPTS